jgi:hypothetical protein
MTVLWHNVISGTVGSCRWCRLLLFWVSSV